jgi:hypothetical protein
MNVVFKWTKGCSPHDIRLVGVESADAVYRAIDKCIEDNASLELVGSIGRPVVIHKTMLRDYEVCLETE